MKRSQRIRRERRALYLRSYRRWLAFQPDREQIRAAIRNHDGSVARPRFGVITPAQEARHAAREARRALFDSPAYREVRIAAERQIGATLDFASLTEDQQAIKAGRPVVRIVTLPGPGLQPEGFATGFLVDCNLLLTNFHVFPDAGETRTSGAQFLYERTATGMREGVLFELDPDTFFVNDRALDYAIVAVKPESRSRDALQQFQYLPLIEAKGKILKGDPVNIIQHPQGGPKQYAMVNNRLLDIRDDGFLLYETDTLEGSSGSPVFNRHWETIALHHQGVPMVENDKLVTRDGKRVELDADIDDGDLIWVANEGVRVSALVESLRKQRLTRPEQQRILQTLIGHTSDPLLRVPAAGPGPVAASSGPTLPSQEGAVPIRFEFHGPVTVQVTGAAGADLTSVALPAAGPETPPPSAEGFALEKVLRFDEEYAKRDTRGYDPAFLAGWKVPVPRVNARHHGKLLQKSGRPWMIPYYHYSLVMNRDRRLLAWSAANVDYSAAGRKHTKTRKEYGADSWRLDPRVALEAPGLQINGPEFYDPAKKIDQGHIVRREDGAWGRTAKEAEFGNSDTFHFTNCTPQSFAFNRSQEDEGIWGQFENHIASAVKAEGGRMSLFAGPVLNPGDPRHGYDGRPPVQVPMEFWKVVMCVSSENGRQVKRAYGFVFDQRPHIQKYGFERMDMDDFEIQQTTLKEITKKTGVVFDASVMNADVLRTGPGHESLVGKPGLALTSVEDIVLR